MRERIERIVLYYIQNLDGRLCCYDMADPRLAGIATSQTRGKTYLT
jgi:hypothetical protein